MYYVRGKLGQVILLLADYEDLENLSASETHVTRFKQQEVAQEICRCHVQTELSNSWTSSTPTRRNARPG